MVLKSGLRRALMASEILGGWWLLEMLRKKGNTRVFITGTAGLPGRGEVSGSFFLTI